MFAKLLGRSRVDDEATMRLYHAIVAQARQPVLYQRFAVPDTVEGRFEMIVLHSVLFFARLQREGEVGKALAQKVFDLFATDMDRSLREMGVGDLGVPKRMKAIGRSFYGRLEAYGKPLADGDRAGLAEALQRNLFPDEALAPVQTEDLAAYAFAVSSALDDEAFADLAKGDVRFPDPTASLRSEATA
jgi:cytochrome b pre-mRNA-processing protein 3